MSTRLSSAAAGAWAARWLVRRSTQGAMYASAWVVLFGISASLARWGASVVPSSASFLLRTSCSRCVTNTDSAMVLVGISPRTVFAVAFGCGLWYASNQGKRRKWAGQQCQLCVTMLWVGCGERVGGWQ